jgi:hypothetical protein
MHATAAVLGRALLRRLTDTEALAAHAALLTQVPEPPVESRRVEVPSTRPPDDKAPRIGAIVLAPIFDGLAKRLAERVTVAARALDLTATVHLHSSNKTSSVTTPKLVPHLLELFRLCRKTLAQCAHEVFGRDRVEQIPRALKHRALAKAERCQARIVHHRDVCDCWVVLGANPHCFANQLEHAAEWLAFDGTHVTQCRSERGDEKTAQSGLRSPGTLLAKMSTQTSTLTRWWVRGDSGASVMRMRRCWGGSFDMRLCHLSLHDGTRW